MESKKKINSCGKLNDEGRKVRFLATGDFHSDLRMVEYIRQYVKDLNLIDFVLFVGDLSDRKDDFKKLLEIFDGKKIFMVPGNHESSKQLEVLREKYGVHIVGNSPVLLDDEASVAIFGSNYVPIGPFGVSEEGIFHNLIENFKAVEDAKFKIMLNHLPPYGTYIGSKSPFPFVQGSIGVRAFLENFTPDVSFCGHIHESSGLEEIVNKTNVVNVGRTFKVFEFDFDKSELSLVSK